MSSSHTCKHVLPGGGDQPRATGLQRELRIFFPWSISTWSSPFRPSLSVMQASPAGQWIARIAYWNKKAAYGLLFKASAQTVTTIAADPKRLGARVGMISVLHTWGSTSC